MFIFGTNLIFLEDLQTKTLVSIRKVFKVVHGVIMISMNHVWVSLFFLTFKVEAILLPNIHKE